MVGVLIGMRCTVLRRSVTGTQAANIGSGAVCGLALAAGMIWLAARGTPHTADLLVLALAGWLVGWLVGPAIGGGDLGIRREHFALLPIRRRGLALGLLGAALVGVGPAVTLLALAALVVYGATLGAAAALVAVPAAVLFLVLLVVLARLVVAAIGALLSSRTTAALSALPWAVLVAGMAQCWVVFVALGGGADPLDDGLPASAARALRVLPSGWPVVALEAADRGQWPLVAGVLAGTAGLAALALLAWARLLDRPAPSPVIRGSAGRPIRPRRSGDPAPTGDPALVAVFGKELRTWARDLVRIHYLSFAVAYGLVFALMPGLLGITGLVPATGLVVAIMIASSSAHLYSSDGTALWLTLMTPGVERADVRGRQLAWLVVVGPLTVLLTLAGLLWTGHWWMLPLLTALLPAVLGGGAGLVVLVSVLVPVRMPDPHRRGSNPGQDGGPVGGLIWLMLVLVAVVAAPAVALLWLGGRSADPALTWAATPVGLVGGALLAWGLGRIAYRRLTGHGPELLGRVGRA